MIQEINKSILNSEEASMLAIRLTNSVLSMNLTDDFFKKLVEHIHMAMNELDAAMTRTRGSKFTELLKQTDRTQRDPSFISFKNYILSCLDRRKEEVKEAASRIYGVIEKYGTRLYELSYDQQTIKTNQLLKELKDDFSGDLAVLGAGPWLEELESSQREFEELTDGKLHEASQKIAGPLRESKDRVLDYIEVLIGAMNKMLEFYPGVYDEKILLMEEAVKKIMAAARARETRKESDE